MTSEQDNLIRHATSEEHDEVATVADFINLTFGTLGVSNPVGRGVLTLLMCQNIVVSGIDVEVLIETIRRQHAALVKTLKETAS